jgi:hypothetical protein
LPAIFARAETEIQVILANLEAQNIAIAAIHKMLEDVCGREEIYSRHDSGSEKDMA